MKKTDLVVKSNELIEASYRLTAGEQKVLLKMVSEIKADDVDFKVYKFKISEFLEMLEIKDQSKYKKVPEITRGLIQKVFTINNDNRILQTSWLSSAEYIKGEGCIEVCFDPKLKPFLLNLKSRFTKYTLKDVIQLKSGYSIRMYELLKQYQKIGEKTFEVVELKKILGIGENEYKLYGHFKSRVILTSQKELKAKTDIAFIFKELGEGKKVEKIVFFIMDSEKKVSEQHNEFKRINVQISLEVSNIIEQFKKVTGEVLHPDRVNDLIILEGLNKVQYYLDNLDKFETSEITDIAGFFYKAVRDSYSIPTKNFTKSIRKEKIFE